MCRKVKSCPFCGVELEFIKLKKGDIYHHPWNECIARAWYFDAHNKRCIKLWNTRKPMERIVERLEEEKMRYFLTIANTGNEKLDAIYEEVGNAIDKAIEIIKEEGAE